MRLDKKFESKAEGPEAEVAVNISYDIIQHVSRQLYTNPRKAIEELICNSYDSGAPECYVHIPDQEGLPLAVLDNGSSMDLSGMKTLWQVAVSPKKPNEGDLRIYNNRIQIGKFGVGKLAAFALGGRLTHVAAVDGFVRIISVGLIDIKDRPDGGKPTFSIFRVPEHEAQSLLDQSLEGLPKPWIKGWRHWTLAIISEIDPGAVGSALKIGFLKRMVRTALPVSAQFKVFIDGDPVPSREIPPEEIQTRVNIASPEFKEWLERALKEYWLVETLKEKPEDVPKDAYTCTIGELRNPNDPSKPISALMVPNLGPVAGEALIAKDTLTTEKLSERGYRDNGFAVFVHGKQVNPEDELFGITQRSHHFWRRFLATVEMPGLDKALLVQRNSVSENSITTQVAREVLRALYGKAKAQAEDIEETGKYIPPPFGARLRSLSHSKGLTALRGLTGGKVPEGGLPSIDVEFQTMGEEAPPARYDEASHRILVNDDHPVLAALDEMGGPAKQLRHVLGETIAGTLMAGGFLKAEGVRTELVDNANSLVDDALRSAVGFLRDPVQTHIEEIEEASRVGGARFEHAVVRAFRGLRLAAARFGEPDEADGIIEIPLAGRDNLRISIEAKGCNGIVTHKELQAATVDRHRKELGCSKAIAIAREFQSDGLRGKDSALFRETMGEIPLITTEALAVLLRLNQKRPFTQDKIVDILTTWKAPDELCQYIEEVWKSLPDLGLLSDILDAAEDIKGKDNKNYPDPGMVVAHPFMKHRNVSKTDVIKVIQAIEATTDFLVIRNQNNFEFDLQGSAKTIKEAMVKSSRSDQELPEPSGRTPPAKA